MVLVFIVLVRTQSWNGNLIVTCSMCHACLTQLCFCVSCLATTPEHLVVPLVYVFYQESWFYTAAMNHGHFSRDDISILACYNEALSLHIHRWRVYLKDLETPMDVAKFWCRQWRWFRPRHYDYWSWFKWGWSAKCLTVNHQFSAYTKRHLHQFRLFL